MSVTNETLLSRITFDRNIFGGKPIIRGMRISVAMILELLSNESSMQEILEDYPDLEIADIQAALQWGN
jgi:uncharacterized protein (DUF433 family)